MLIYIYIYVYVYVCHVCVYCLTHVDSLTEASQPIKEPVKKKGENRRAEKLLAAGQKMKHALVSR